MKKKFIKDNVLEQNNNWLRVVVITTTPKSNLADYIKQEKLHVTVIKA
mgnify:CR=1 FL=1